MINPSIKIWDKAMNAWFKAYSNLDDARVKLDKACYNLEMAARGRNECEQKRRI